MNDRLHELHESTTFNETELVDVPIDIDSLDTPAGLQDFNNEVDKLKLSIVQIKSNIDTLISGYRAVLVSTGDSTTLEDNNRRLEERIEAAIKETADTLKKMSTDIQTSNEQVRWKTNVHSHLTKRFMDIMVQYRGLQSEHREKVQERMRQRLQIVKPEASAEEIQQVIDGGSLRLNVFASEVALENTAQARDALTYVEGRHRELLQIEESVNELHRLFCDLAVLVNAQGEHIDNIEANVATSVAFVEDANRHLVAANKKASRRRWCKFWSIIICLILLGVAALVLILTGATSKWWGLKP